MAAADDHLPAAARDGGLVALGEAAIGGGRQGDPQPVEIAARGALLDLVGVEPGAMVEAAARRDEVFAGIERQGARLQPVGAARPKLGAAALAPPAGKADVVGVEMGRQRPGSRAVRP